MEPISTIATVALPVLGKLLGDAFSAGDRAEAERLQRQILELYGPEALDDVIARSTVGPSAFNDYQADPQAMSAQRLALARLAEDASTPGLNAEERFDLTEAQGDAAQFERGQREAILQNAQARGVGGSGLELQALLSSQQGGAMRSSRAAGEAAANAARRRALANLQMGQMGGQMRQQGFGEFSAKASADDSIAKFNADTTRGVLMGGKAAQANALQGAANAKLGQASQTQSGWAGTGAAAGTAAGGIAKELIDLEKERLKYGGGN